MSAGTVTKESADAGTDIALKLGYSAWAMPEIPVAAQIELVQSLGYVGIELVSGPRSSLDALTASVAERKEIRRLLDAAGLALPSIAGHGNLLEADPEKRAEQKARVEANIDLAADLAGGTKGTPCMVCMGYGKPDQYEAVREQIAQNFGELSAYGEKRGVVVALEPHVGQAFDLPEKVLWLLERVNSPFFRLNFDNSHFEVMGRDIEEYVPLLAPYSVHTHVKDQRGISPDYQFLVPGEGTFDYPRYIKAMDKAGYNGFLTVEISKQIQNRPDYDAAATAKVSFETLTAAAKVAGVKVKYRE
jgi:sugar phosphate isomerase/epimerase